MLDQTICDLSIKICELQFNGDKYEEYKNDVIKKLKQLNIDIDKSQLKYSELENNYKHIKETNDALEITNKNNDNIISNLRKTVEDIENKLLATNVIINDEKEINKKSTISLNELNNELILTKKQNNLRKIRLVNN